MERMENKGVEYLNFTGLNQRMAYRFPGPSGPQSTASNNVQGAIRKVAALDDATIAALRDPRLSPAGRVERVAPQRTAAVQAVADATARLGAEVNRIDAARAALYAPPALDPTDAVGAELDAEIRRRYPQVEGAMRNTLRDELAAGKQSRILLALLRDPLPTPDADWTRAVWTDHIDATHGAEVAALDSAAADAEWALSVT
jgi:hypothetical protein